MLAPPSHVLPGCSTVRGSHGVQQGYGRKLQQGNGCSTVRNTGSITGGVQQGNGCQVHQGNGWSVAGEQVEYNREKVEYSKERVEYSKERVGYSKEWVECSKEWVEYIIMKRWSTPGNKWSTAGEQVMEYCWETGGV